MRLLFEFIPYHPLVWFATKQVFGTCSICKKELEFTKETLQKHSDIHRSRGNQ